AVDGVEAVPYRRLRRARGSGEDETLRRHDARDPLERARLAAEDERNGRLGPDDGRRRRRWCHPRERQGAAEIGFRRPRIPFEALRDGGVDEAKPHSLDLVVAGTGKAGRAEAGERGDKNDRRQERAEMEDAPASEIRRREGGGQRGGEDG